MRQFEKPGEEWLRGIVGGAGSAGSAAKFAVSTATKLAGAVRRGRQATPAAVMGAGVMAGAASASGGCGPMGCPVPR